RCSMLLLQCLAAGLYNTKPLTSKLPNWSCVPAKPLELRRWYLIMLLLQSMAPSGYSHNLQAPKLWMQQISTNLDMCSDETLGATMFSLYYVIATMLGCWSVQH